MTAIKVAEAEAGARRRRRGARHGRQHRQGAERRLGLRPADIKAADATPPMRRGQKVKVIFENCYLQDEHKIRLCEICGELGPTGSRPRPATAPAAPRIDDLRSCAGTRPPTCRSRRPAACATLDALLDVRALGVSRAAPRTAEMLDECRRRFGVNQVGRQQERCAGPAASPSRSSPELRSACSGLRFRFTRSSPVHFSAGGIVACLRSSRRRFQRSDCCRTERGRTRQAVSGNVSSMNCRFRNPASRGPC